MPRPKGWFAANVPIAERFTSKTSPSSAGDCLLWTGAANNKGYGVMTIAGMRERFAHRIAWILKHGVIPVGLCVLHHCDTPACVNVDHLFLGTKAANTADMVKKGRARGATPRETCGRGHAFTIRPNGQKKCRACENAAQRKRRAA